MLLCVASAIHICLESVQCSLNWPGQPTSWAYQRAMLLNIGRVVVVDAGPSNEVFEVAL